MKQRHIIGIWTDEEIAELHPGVAALPFFVVPSLKRLQLPTLDAYLAAGNIDPYVIVARDEHLFRIHRKVGTMIINKQGSPLEAGAFPGAKRFFQADKVTLHWQDYELFQLAKARNSDHVETVRFFMEHFPRQTWLNSDGSKKANAGPAGRADANRKHNQRRKEAKLEARNRTPGKRDPLISCSSPLPKGGKGCCGALRSHGIRH